MGCVPSSDWSRARGDEYGAERAAKADGDERLRHVFARRSPTSPCPATAVDAHVRQEVQHRAEHELATPGHVRPAALGKRPSNASMKACAIGSKNRAAQLGFRRRYHQVAGRHPANTDRRVGVQRHRGPMTASSTRSRASIGRLALRRPGQRASLDALGHLIALARSVAANRPASRSAAKRFLQRSMYFTAVELARSRPTSVPRTRAGSVERPAPDRLDRSPRWLALQFHKLGIGHSIERLLNGRSSRSSSRRLDPLP